MLLSTQSILKDLPSFYAPLFTTSSRAEVNEALASELKVNFGKNYYIHLLTNLNYTYSWRSVYLQLVDILEWDYCVWVAF